MNKIHNYTSETFRHPQPPSLKRKRKQIHTSCRICRSRKIACDRQKPCRNCSSLGCEDRCHYDSAAEVVQDNGTAGRGPSKVATNGHAKVPESVEARLHRLESLLGRVEKLDGTLDSASEEPSPLHHVSPSTKTSSPYANAIVDSNKCPEGSFYIGQHNWVKPFSQDMKFFWQNRPSFQNRYASLLSHRSRFSSERRKTLWDFPRLPASPPAAETDLLAMLPEPNTCDIAVTRFLRTFNRIYFVVSEDLFRQEIEAFRHQSASPPPGWLALYLGVIAIGLQTPIFDMVPDIVISKGRVYGKSLMASSVQYAIHVAQSLPRPSLAAFQALLLAVVQEKLDVDWVDGNGLTSGLLGMLTRMSVTMGLHRDPDFFEIIGDGLKKEEEELRRTLYWTLTFLDMENSLQCGVPWQYSKHGHDVNDPTWPNTWWGDYMSFVIRLAPLCNELLRMSHSHRIVTPLSAVRRLEDRLALLEREIRTSTVLPAYNTPHTPSQVVTAFQQTLLLCTVNRCRTLLPWSLLDTADETSKTCAEQQMLLLAKSMVHDVMRLFDRISTQERQDQDTWKHMLIAVLRCSAYNAISLLLNVCRRTTRRRVDTQHEFAPQAILLETHSLLTRLDSLVPLSYEMTKHQTLYWMQFRTVEAQIAADFKCKPTIEDINPDTHAGRVLIEVTQQCMGTEFSKILNALDEACRSADPPPNLLTSTVDEIHSDVALAKTYNATSLLETDADSYFLDWFSEFDDFATNKNMFTDLSTAWL